MKDVAVLYEGSNYKQVKKSFLQVSGQDKIYEK